MKVCGQDHDSFNKISPNDETFFLYLLKHKQAKLFHVLLRRSKRKATNEARTSLTMNGSSIWFLSYFFYLDTRTKMVIVTVNVCCAKEYLLRSVFARRCVYSTKVAVKLCGGLLHNWFRWYVKSVRQQQNMLFLLQQNSDNARNRFYQRIGSVNSVKWSHQSVRTA